MKYINPYRFQARKWLFDRIFPRGRQYIQGSKLPDSYHYATTPRRNIRIIAQKPDPNARGIVILAHPYLAEASDFFIKSGHLRLYEELGFQVIFFDFNGFGESPFNDFHFDLDVLEVYQWARANHTYLPLHLHGISFGASQCLRFLKNQSSDVKSAIIENCLDKSIHYFKVRNKKIYYFLRFTGLIRPHVRSEGNFTEIIRFARNINQMAFIYGKNDNLTTPEMGVLLQANCPVPSDFLLYEGKHLKAIEEKQIYQEFLQQFLSGNG